MYSLFIFFLSQWIAWYQALRARESSTLPTRSTERTSTREWKKKRWKREAKKNKTKQKIVAYSGVKFKATAKAKRFLFFAKGPREKESRYEIQRIPPFSVLMAIRKTHKIESIRTHKSFGLFSVWIVSMEISFDDVGQHAICVLTLFYYIFQGRCFLASLYRFAVTMQLQLLTRPIVEQLWKVFHLHLQCQVPFTNYNERHRLRSRFLTWLDCR